MSFSSDYVCVKGVCVPHCVCVCWFEHTPTQYNTLPPYILPAGLRLPTRLCGANTYNHWKCLFCKCVCQLLLGCPADDCCCSEGPRMVGLCAIHFCADYVAPVSVIHLPRGNILGTHHPKGYPSTVLSRVWWEVLPHSTTCWSCSKLEQQQQRRRQQW